MKKFPPVSMPSNPLVRGDKAPTFELQDPINGGILRSPEILRSGPALLTFYRGAWCGCCETDLRDVAQQMPLFTAKNVNVLGVFHDLDKDANARIRKTYKLEFLLVDDPEGRVAEQFGIRRSASEMARIEDEFGPEQLELRESQPWIMPMQVRYLIGRDGIIAQSEIVTDYNDRSSAVGLLPILETLR
jgi:peroxiredoxin